MSNGSRRRCCASLLTLGRFVKRRIEKNEDGTLTVYYKGKDGQEHSVVAGIVMFGTGRKPNTDKVGVDVSCS